MISSTKRRDASDDGSCWMRCVGGNVRAQLWEVSSAIDRGRTEIIATISLTVGSTRHLHATVSGDAVPVSQRGFAETTLDRRDWWAALGLMR